MIYHVFDRVTGEHLATRRLQEQAVAPPSNSTAVDPPIPSEGHVPVWSGFGWSEVEDHRGKTLYGAEGAVRHRELGPIPDGFTDEAPPSEFHRVVDGQWQEDVAAVAEEEAVRTAATQRKELTDRLLDDYERGAFMKRELP